MAKMAKTERLLLLAHFYAFAFHFVLILKEFLTLFILTAFELILFFRSKESSQKVTTPPPFRKLSTGNAFNVINVNSKIQAAAAAAAAAAIKQSEETSDGLSIQRSSSHESHLRNKIDHVSLIKPRVSPDEICDEPSEDKTGNSLKTLEPLRRLSTEGSENSSRGPSGKILNNLLTLGFGMRLYLFLID